MDNDVFAHIKPLDLVLFSGHDFVSKFIKFVEKEELGEGTFSHVGIVVTRECLPFLTQLEPNTLYVWESTMSIRRWGGDGIPDVERQKTVFGVQLRPLREVVETYTQTPGTSVAWAPLINNPWKNGNKEQQRNIINKMKKVYFKYRNKGYDYHCIDLFATFFKTCRTVRDWLDETEIEGYHIIGGDKEPRTLRDMQDERMFCSELVGVVYQSLNFLPPHIIPANIAPMDYVVASRIPRIIGQHIYLDSYSENGINKASVQHFLTFMYGPADKADKTEW
jgi:hypothetical protein